MPKSTVDLTTFRRDMKALGYKVSVSSGSQFATATIKHDGKPVNGANVLTQEHLDEHVAFYDYKNAHSVVDGDMRVMF